MTMTVKIFMEISMYKKLPNFQGQLLSLSSLQSPACSRACLLDAPCFLAFSCSIWRLFYFSVLLVVPFCFLKVLFECLLLASPVCSSSVCFFWVLFECLSPVCSFS